MLYFVLCIVDVDSSLLSDDRKGLVRSMKDYLEIETPETYPTPAISATELRRMAYEQVPQIRIRRPSLLVHGRRQT